MKIYEIIEISEKDAWFEDRKILIGKKFQEGDIWWKIHKGSGWYSIELSHPIGICGGHPVKLFFMVKLRQVEE